MSLTDDNLNATMLMQPAYGAPYGGGGFGGLFGGNNDLLGLLFVIALCNGGCGGFGFGGGYGAMMGMGMMGMDYLYPWLNNSQNINDGFRDQQLATQANGIQNAITSGFGDVQTTLCSGFAGVNQNVSNGFANTNLNLCNGINSVNNSIFGAQTAISQQMSANEMASLNRSFAEQSANQQGFNGVQSGIADLRYTTAKESCDTRTQAAMNTRDIIDAIKGGDQMIYDKLCALELDGVKTQLAQAQRENVGLQNQLNMANFNASQTAQNAFFADGLNREVDALYNRLKNCPVNTVPVYGNQPIFTCSQNVANSNFGCGCNGNNF